MNAPAVPDGLRSLITAAVAREIAAVYEEQVVFPGTVVVDDQRFPDWPEPVLLISVENQGVCAWGVPLGRPDPPVVVGGEFGTVVHSPDPAAFVASRRWDGRCLSGLLIQAQAAELDEPVLAFLRDHYDELAGSHGWPGRHTYRFQRGRVRIMLWDAPGQCDWWISGAGPGDLAVLLHLSDLRASLWSTDPGGEALLAGLRRDREAP